MNDRILGIAALVFAALMTWFGWDIEAPFSYEPVGPRAFPLLVAFIIALCGVWMVVKGGNQAEANPAGANSRITLMVAYCAAYAYFFQLLGFIVATTCMTVLVGRLFSGSWLKVISGGLIMSGLFFFLFDRGLDVVLPTGILGGLL
ncbi:tripartite tricarboxylate transporter TctB family protein [Paralcaligenes sp. KSB-10]|jgi:putative tricarboxylic transport membrane protein|uniref:tripartite tricarboxylate transporter TctB family protein n=1 Tax=Paralcaligenes sp. KSB-10 TaxID=2901142 RepID=UPI001E47B9EF|nr:tripartite tricarboxylate transporter TctB family protein [Paralcaligenes sp. KSB-10]UHL63558.1 tripartite tricarboxylate transporter TctB family protein [Paralcaligenes sp. KSB-10]